MNNSSPSTLDDESERSNTASQKSKKCFSDNTNLNIHTSYIYYMNCGHHYH